MSIKNIFENKTGEEEHTEFLKYGRGIYKNRFLLEGKKQKKGWTIKTGPEYANYLVKQCLTKAPETINIKGIIVTTQDIKEDIPFEIKKASNFQGIRKLQIETETTTKKVQELIKKHPRLFYALSFKGETFNLKIKAKAPKSGKPGKENEEGPKADFITIKTEDEEIVKELFFKEQKFETITINHEINIKEIIYPKNYETLKPKEIREQSKRKGTITRNKNINGTTTKEEKEFEV
jgi:hypothetical protein